MRKIPECIGYREAQAAADVVLRWLSNLRCRRLEVRRRSHYQNTSDDKT